MVTTNPNQKHVIVNPKIFRQLYDIKVKMFRETGKANYNLVLEKLLSNEKKQ